MNTKLTLTLERDVIEKAKEHAKANNRSLSDLVENYLKMITGPDQVPIYDLTPLVKSLKGSFKTPASFNYKDELEKALNEKYM